MKIDFDTIDKRVYWDVRGLKVTRLRLLSDSGFPYWDVSYCIGILNGEAVFVDLPFNQIPKAQLKSYIIARAKKDNIYAKGLGILSNISKHQ